MFYCLIRRCECAVGFEGKNCSTNTNDCKSGICQNGATCVDGIASYSCMCARGYSGRHCEIAPVLALQLTGFMTGACKYHNCQNNGVCYKPSGYRSGYLCKCAPGINAFVVAYLISSSLNTLINWSFIEQGVREVDGENR